MAIAMYFSHDITCDKHIKATLWTVCSYGKGNIQNIDFTMEQIKYICTKVMSKQTDDYK